MCQNIHVPESIASNAAALQAEQLRLRERRQVMEELRMNIDQIDVRLRNMPRAVPDTQQDLEELRRQLIQFQAVNAEMRALLRQREVEIGRLESQIQAVEAARRNAAGEAESESLRNLEVFLRGAVQSGKATTAP